MIVSGVDDQMLHTLGHNWYDDYHLEFHPIYHNIEEALKGPVSDPRVAWIKELPPKSRKKIDFCYNL